MAVVSFFSLDVRAEDDRATELSPFLLEGRAGGAFGSSFGGDIGGCSGCQTSLVYGWALRGSLGYELQNGLGLTLDVGYRFLRQDIYDRATTLAPLPTGSEPVERGALDHEITARGPAFGAAVYVHRGTKVRLTGRLGAGIWIGSASDVRSGRFTTSVSQRPDGSIGTPAAYDVGPLEQTSDARYLYAAPELRVGIPLVEHLELSAGIEAVLSFAVRQPRWNPDGTVVTTGTCRTSTTPDCVSDGKAVFDASKLMSQTFFLVSPGVVLRYEL
jgi:hypothetical protein